MLLDWNNNNNNNDDKSNSKASRLQQQYSMIIVNDHHDIAPWLSTTKGSFSPSPCCVASQSRLFGLVVDEQGQRPRNDGPRRRRHSLSQAMLGRNGAIHSFLQYHHATASPLLLQQSTALPALAAAATTTTTTTSVVGFWKLLTAFCLGGIFFSTALAAASACYAVGMQNVRTLLSIVRAVVIAIWSSFVAALRTAKEALLLQRSTEKKKRQHWQWRAAWQVLQQELIKTRQTAAAGVMALRQEAALYAGAVGAPGLIPVQYSLDRFLPLFVAQTLETSLKESLTDIARQTRSIRKVKLTAFSVGNTSPQLQAARVYDLGNQAAAYDVDVDWPASELEIKLMVITPVARIPVVVRNVQFQGTVRVILTPFTAQPPGFGAALVSFPKAPRLNLNVRVAGGDITRIPWLRSELVAAIQKGIAEQLLWPKRLVIPSLAPVWTGTGLREKPILSASVLSELERTDPLLEREQALAQESPMLRDQYQAPQLSLLKQQFKVFVNPRQANDDGNAKSNSKESSTIMERNGKNMTTATLMSHNDNDSSSHNVVHDNQNENRLAKIQKGILWQGLFSRNGKKNDQKQPMELNQL